MVGNLNEDRHPVGAEGTSNHVDLATEATAVGNGPNGVGERAAFQPRPMTLLTSPVKPWGLELSELELLPLLSEDGTDDDSSVASSTGHETGDDDSPIESEMRDGDSVAVLIESRTGDGNSATSQILHGTEDDNSVVPPIEHGPKDGHSVASPHLATRPSPG